MSGPILVLGATSCAGRGVVEAALAAGRSVLAASLDHPGLLALKTAHPRAELTLLPGGFADETAAEALAADVRELGRPLAGIVVADGRAPVGGRVLEQGAGALRRELDAELLPQFAAARALLPLLAEGGRNGSYVVVAGPGGERPWAGYGHRSVASAATRMLVRVLHDEARALSVRVHLLAVEMPARSERNATQACAHWPSTRAIGERALALLEQRDGSRADEAIVRFVPDAAPAATPARLASGDLLPRNAEHERRARVSTTTTLPPSQRRALDDAWNLLQPLLSPDAPARDTAAPPSNKEKKKAPTP